MGRVFLKIIKLYQNIVSPNLQKNCRFWPSCSQYFYLSIEKYGLSGGLFKGIKRLAKCHPWHEGGIDQP
ncbi:MAG: membrane protein insertion efficiency factor YidD [Patescibacteria group bacterium]